MNKNRIVEFGLLLQEGDIGHATVNRTTNVFGFNCRQLFHTRPRKLKCNHSDMMFYYGSSFANRLARGAQSLVLSLCGTGREDGSNHVFRPEMGSLTPVVHA